MARCWRWIFCRSQVSDTGGPLLVGSWLSWTYQYICIIFVPHTQHFTSLGKICTSFLPSVCLTCISTKANGKQMQILDWLSARIILKFLIRIVKNTETYHSGSHKNRAKNSSVEKHADGCVYRGSAGAFIKSGRTVFSWRKLTEISGDLERVISRWKLRWVCFMEIQPNQDLRNLHE